MSARNYRLIYLFLALLYICVAEHRGWPFAINVVWADSQDAPHASVSVVRGSETASTAQTDNPILDPDTGFALALMGCHLASDGNNSDLRIELEATNVDVIAPQLVATNPILITAGHTPLWVGAINESLDWTSVENAAPAHGVANVTCWGYQFTP